MCRWLRAWARFSPCRDQGQAVRLPNSEILIHQPLGGVRGQATDIKIHTEWLIKIKNKINRILSENTGQPLERIERDVERDFFMSAEDAKDYGIVDHIMDRKKK